jgi:co-chaperonin GroES (HSP10)
MFQDSYTNEDTTYVGDKDPDISGLKIKGWNILVRPIHVAEKTKGGIHLPGKTTDDLTYLMNVCKVLKVGPQAYSQDMFQGDVWCEEGDYVLIPRNCGTKIKYQGTPLTLVACDRVLLTIDDPKDLDPTFDIV